MLVVKFYYWDKDNKLYEITEVINNNFNLPMNRKIKLKVITSEITEVVSKLNSEVNNTISVLKTDIYAKKIIWKINN